MSICRVKAAHIPPREGLTLWETLLGAISPSLSFPFLVLTLTAQSLLNMSYLHALPMHFPLRFRPHINILKVLKSPTATKMLNVFCWGEGLLFLSPYCVCGMLRALGDGCCDNTHFTVEGTEAQRGKVTYSKVTGKLKNRDSVPPVVTMICLLEVPQHNYWRELSG